MSPSPAHAPRDGYEALAAFLERPADELARAIPPARVAALLRYHRRQAARRATCEALASRLGIDPTVVFGACTPEGAEALLAALGGPRPRLRSLPGRRRAWLQARA